MTTRVLVVDDDDDVRALLREVLESDGHEVITARDGVEGLDIARSQVPDAVVLDVMMPRMDGLTTLEAARADGRLAHLPILLLSGRAHTADAVKGLRQGADDYIIKPFDADELTARVAAAIRRAEQQRSRSPLTGLPGNEFILATVSARIDGGVPTALLYIDLNSFKPFNDHYGFLRGDHALRALAGLLTDIAKELGTEDTFVGHVGGDDFILLTIPERAEAIAQEICTRFDVLAPELYDHDDRAAGSIEVPDRRGVVQRYALLSLSIGVALTDRIPDPHPGELVAIATEMKRYAKARMSSGSRFAIDRRDETDDELELEVDLP